MANMNASEMKDKGRETVNRIKDDPQGVAHDVADKAKGIASDLTDKARNVASTVADKADDWTGKAGGAVRTAGTALRDHGPDSGMLGSAKNAVADTLDRGGRYIEKEGLSGMADDLTEMVRKNPLPALLLGVGVGYLLAKVTRS